ncbi:phosphoribosyl-ATP pyrophosphatase [Acetobacter sp. TBRC 12305]|uniref:Phosphoribosyl-ATP pyrophosphatase n=1 Tax=Acetobacter garciniae TaxID=2817435 RepID=A0A939HKH9_9PROT|nr:phosphoribosyl-ATP pyrophosphatase [Acetobacter garciniae]MBX0345157.1 phosphoribosyl-ATP pyrophosphatase [Acetobacter garciniae]
MESVDIALLRLSQKVGLHATNCTAALIANRRDDIIRESASFLKALEQLWAHETVDPADIWTELLRRLEVAELLHQLNQPPHRKKRSGKVPRPWRITTSKLP